LTFSNAASSKALVIIGEEYANVGRSGQALLRRTHPRFQFGHCRNAPRISCVRQREWLKLAA
jgi:hypothetical protein